MQAKVEQAIITAAKLHAGQKRRLDSLPYVYHPYQVALLLRRYTNREAVLAAGLLHDVLEDVPGYTKAKLRRRFGATVCRIVCDVTEDRALWADARSSRRTWLERKTKYLEHLEHCGTDAVMVSCADKIDNLSSMLASYKKQGGKMWQQFHAPQDKQRWLYGRLHALYVRRLNSGLSREFNKVYREAVKVFGW